LRQAPPPPPHVTPAQAGAHDDGRQDAYQRSDEVVPLSGIASVEACRGCRRFIVCDLRRGRRDDVPGEAHNFPSPHSCTSMGRGCPEGAGEGRPLVRNALPPLTPGFAGPSPREGRGEGRQATLISFHKTYPRPCARPHTGPVRFDKKSGIRGAGCWRSGRSAHVLPRTGTCSGHPPPAET